MSGKTITRADLCEAVYQKVGLSRTESAALVELVLRRDHRLPRARRDGEAVLVRFLRGAQEGPARRPQSEDRQGGADLAAPGHGVQAVGVLKQRINGMTFRTKPKSRSFAFEVNRTPELKSPSRERCAVDKAPDAFRTISEVADDLECRSTCCASGKADSADQADEARRRTALLPARRRRPSARHSAICCTARATRSAACSAFCASRDRSSCRQVWEPGAAQPAVLPDRPMKRQWRRPSHCRPMRPRGRCSACCRHHPLRAPKMMRKPKCPPLWRRLCWPRCRRPPRSSRATTSGGCKALCMNCENAGD